jgi:hypothetical protein
MNFSVTGTGKCAQVDWIYRIRCIYDRWWCWAFLGVSMDRLKCPSPPPKKVSDQRTRGNDTPRLTFLQLEIETKQAR